MAIFNFCCRTFDRDGSGKLNIEELLKILTWDDSRMPEGVLEVVTEFQDSDGFIFYEGTSSTGRAFSFFCKILSFFCRFGPILGGWWDWRRQGLMNSSFHANATKCSDAANQFRHFVLHLKK